MGDWLSIILLVFVGLVLIYLELIFVPGTTIVGLVGLVLCIIGVFLTYEKHGDAAGNWVLAGSVLVSVVALFYSFRSNSWNKFSLKATNDGKVNENYYADLQIEMRGVALSDLKPIGKAEFNNKVYEVRSAGQHISSGEQLKISKISSNKITVEIITTN